MAVYCAPMSTYSETLDAYLKTGDLTQEGLGEKIGVSQVAVHRYKTGARFPEAALARKIHDATDGEVSFELWQAEAMRRIGVTEDAPEAEAA